MPILSRNRGFTLIELVIAIVIIGISVTGVLLAYTTLIRHSADPMISYQAVAIAEAYLEEIGSKSYDNLDGVRGLRADFDSVLDYDGIDDQPPVNSLGEPIAAVADYRVRVGVTSETLNGVQARRYAVTVTHPSGIDLTLSGYRTGHF